MEIIQTHSANAKKLFKKLLNTSHRATKSRQRTIDQLKVELDNIIKIEDRLFPLLERQVRDHVHQILKENRQTRALLTHIEHIPKDDKSFWAEVAKLKSTFEHHVRR